MGKHRKKNFLVRTACGLCLGAVVSLSQAQTVQGSQIIFLGTGTPRPQPERQGQSLAIRVNEKIYLVDAGVGVARQASAAALKMEDLRIAFLTHLHTDHTLGLPDLIFTPWIMGRTTPLELYGPDGTKAMGKSILKAYEQDVQIRVHGLEGGNRTGYKVRAHEIKPGVVYQDANVKVTAFSVEHGSWRNAFGYRFDVAGTSIVISGDTRPSKNVVNACDGCDVLIHEVYSGSGGTSQKSPEEWMKYMAAFHTSADELGVLATRARAKKLLITHYVAMGSSTETEMVSEVKRSFAGKVVVARDLEKIGP